MSITHITSVSQLNGILAKSNDKLTIIDFHATWCGPCHAIAPVFESLSKQYKNVNFLKCDTDAASDVSSLYRISAMPTFIFLKGSTKVDEVRGANKYDLENAVKRHSSSASTGGGAFSGKGQTLGGAPAPVDLKRQMTDSVNGVAGTVSNVDPQLKVLLALVGAYLLFWYLS